MDQLFKFDPYLNNGVQISSFVVQQGSFYSAYQGFGQT